jgi:tRNA U34 5-methylaminomethyl-2-thiouridine-forming methyltransferase MnmC
LTEALANLLDDRILRPAELTAVLTFVKNIKQHLKTAWEPSWYGSVDSKRFAGRLRNASGLIGDIEDFIDTRRARIAAGKTITPRMIPS